MLPCAVEKERESERRRGAVTVLMVTEEPMVVEKVSMEVLRLETERVDRQVIVLMMSEPPSSVETVSGLVKILDPDKVDTTRVLP